MSDAAHAAGLSITRTRPGPKGTCGDYGGRFHFLGHSQVALNITGLPMVIHRVRYLTVTLLTIDKTHLFEDAKRPLDCLDQGALGSLGLRLDLRLPTAQVKTGRSAVFHTSAQCDQREEDRRKLMSPPQQGRKSLLFDYLRRRERERGERREDPKLVTESARSIV